jgi:LCP family protein required for cell wall assembly
MRKKTWLRMTLFCMILVLLILMIYGGLRVVETAIFSEPSQESITTKTIIKDGVKYYPRNDICVVLIMGIDQKGKVVASDEPNHGNAVDMVTLLVFDKKEESASLLAINRDTMVEMPRLNDHGRETGTRVAQLALSHTYGRGMADSCLNTAETISNMFYGIAIDHYFSMSMDAVSILNDAVGGVTVNVTDDFSKVDPSLKKGEITLTGEQAICYVQSRYGVGDQLNLSRIRRQKEYMQGFWPVLQKCIGESDSFVVNTYAEVEDYVVTDMTTEVIMRLHKDYSDYPLKRVISLEGENVLGEEHYEFYPDEEALDALALELFYAPKT